METDPINVRDAIALWESRTFGDWANGTYWADVDVRAELQRHLRALDLSDKRINGSSVTGLEHSQEGGGVGISYTETFFQMVEETKGCNPIDYLYLIVKGAVQKGYEEQKTRGILARGMRTYASLLRDHDFAFKIEQELSRRRLSENFKVSAGSAEDSKNHTDVLVSSDKNNYRIWLFQFSRMGLPHDIERLTQMRGKLPKGIHILCPLKSEHQRELETVSARITRLSERTEAVREKMRSASKMTKTLESLNDKLRSDTQALASCKTRAGDLRSLLDGNITSYHGWYLYGDKAIAETLDTIIGVEDGSIKPRSYMEVYDMLSAPKRYLSNLASFKI